LAFLRFGNGEWNVSNKSTRADQIVLNPTHTQTKIIGYFKFTSNVTVSETIINHIYCNTQLSKQFILS